MHKQAQQASVAELSWSHRKRHVSACCSDSTGATDTYKSATSRLIRYCLQVPESKQIYNDTRLSIENCNATLMFASLYKFASLSFGNLQNACMCFRHLVLCSIKPIASAHRVGQPGQPKYCCCRSTLTSVGHLICSMCCVIPGQPHPLLCRALSTQGGRFKAINKPGITEVGAFHGCRQWTVGAKCQLASAADSCRIARGVLFSETPIYGTWAA